MTQPQDVTLCSTIDGTHKTIFFCFYHIKMKILLLSLLQKEWGEEEKKIGCHPHQGLIR